MQMINANQAEFLRMVNEPAGPGGQASMEQLEAQLAAGGQGGSTFHVCNPSSVYDVQPACILFMT